MAEYGEGEGGRFTEDGSFIGEKLNVVSFFSYGPSIISFTLTGIYGKQPGSEKPKQTNNSSTVV